MSRGDLIQILNPFYPDLQGILGSFGLVLFNSGGSRLGGRVWMTYRTPEGAAVKLAFTRLDERPGSGFLVFVGVKGEGGTWIPGRFSEDIEDQLLATGDWRLVPIDPAFATMEIGHVWTLGSERKIRVGWGGGPRGRR